LLLPGGELFRIGGLGSGDDTLRKLPAIRRIRGEHNPLPSHFSLNYLEIESTVVFLESEHGIGNGGMIQDITPRSENLYAVLRQAIQVERDGYAHYVEAARYTEYLPARRVFMRMAADEESHRNLLEATYAAYKKTGEPGALPVLGSLPDYVPMPPSPSFPPNSSRNA